MKYIRTKDAVMEYKKAIENIKYWFKNVAFEDDEYNIDTETDRLNKSIIKQADTIQELCDEFVYDGEKGTHLRFAHLEDIKLSGWLECANWEIKGAIWTDKGLIYVAKMKGVLPNGEIDWELL